MSSGTLKLDCLCTADIDLQVDGLQTCHGLETLGLISLIVIWLEVQVLMQVLQSVNGDRAI